MSLDSRVAALDGLLEEAGLDAVLATKDASIAYLTGFWGLQMERFFGVAVKRGGAGELFATLDGAKRIGVEEDHLNFSRSGALQEAGYELVPATDLIMHLRAAKDAEEVEAVRRACEHIEAVYDEVWA